MLIVADNLAPPYDEGIKNIAINMIREFSRSHDCSLLTDKGEGVIERTIFADLGKTLTGIFRSPQAKGLTPDVVLYIPSNSLTFFTFIRAAILARIFTAAKILVVGLQARHHGKLARLALALIKPHGIVVLSNSMRDEMRNLSRHTEVFVPGVETSRFAPVSAEEKRRLRERYGIPQEEFVLLHVGHLKASRNLQLVLDGIKELSCLFVVVASSTFAGEEDRSLIASLNDAGVRILSGSIDAIEDIYKLADCYVFPVVARNGATEMPLSVLEAMAVNLPVVTTRYGTLPEVFAEEREKGFCYVDDPASFARAVGEIRALEPSTREMVMPYSWQGRVADLAKKIGSICR